jgi:hypothetical protein
MITYKAKYLEDIERPGYWKYITIGVFKVEGDQETQIGEYRRNYPQFFNTFYYFKKEDKDYALYSPYYTATRIMELPSCKDIGGEDDEGNGFCPTDFYVPSYIDWESVSLDDTLHQSRYNDPSNYYLVPSTYKYTPLDEKTGKRITVEKPQYPITPLMYYPFGFVAGCYWGDDSSWKIQYLDLSEADKGIVKRDERFGYIELAAKSTLKDAIILSGGKVGSTEFNGSLYISIIKHFDLQTGKMIDEDPFDR